MPVVQDEWSMAETLRFCDEQQDLRWESSNLWVLSVLMRQNMICESSDGVGSCEKAEWEKERLSMNKSFRTELLHRSLFMIRKSDSRWSQVPLLMFRLLTNSPLSLFCFPLCFVSVSWYICRLSESVIAFTKAKRWTGAQSSQEIRASIQAENRHFNTLTFLAKCRDPQNVWR